MTTIQRISAASLGLLPAAAAAAWWETAPPSPKTVDTRAAAVTSAALVDESTYGSARTEPGRAENRGWAS